MKVLILNYEQVEDIIMSDTGLRNCLEALEDIYRDYGVGKTANRTRSHTYIPFAGSGIDFMPNAFGGFSINSVPLSQDAKTVETLVRIGLKGLRVMKQDRAFTVDVIQKFTKMDDKEIAQRTYEANIPYFTDDGIISEAEQRAILEESKKQLNVDKPIPLSVFDFSLTQKVKKELGNWKP
jgi:hypothetical protein